MTISEWLAQSEQQLQKAGVATARLDVLVLAEDALTKDRTHLLAHPELELSIGQLNVLNQQVARRVLHEPLAYLRGKAEFYGRQFIVSPGVLIPRPESEAIIELLLARTDLPTKPRIADVGTGSGALGITTQLEFPKASVELLEIDDKALIIAKQNVINFSTSINVIKSDLLASSPQDYDVLLCNLPYVPDEYAINNAAQFEPAIALFAGSDGLDLYRQLFKQIATLSNKSLLILCESFPDQHKQLTKIASQTGYKLDETSDFVQAFKLT